MKVYIYCEQIDQECTNVAIVIATSTQEAKQKFEQKGLYPLDRDWDGVISEFSYKDLRENVEVIT